MLAARRLALLVTIANVAACAPAAPGAPPPGPARPCAGRVEYPTDTVIDGARRNEGLGGALRALSLTGPEYPADLRNAGVGGWAVASFVIDTTGRVPAGTSVITSESHRAFGQAVCTWLGRTRFEPLVIGGRRYSVRVLNFPTNFTLSP